MNFAARTNELSRSHHIVDAEHVISAGDTVVEATLSAPLRPRGVVLLLHASSAARFAPHNRFVGQALDQADVATLQVDLLTPAEDAARDDRASTKATDALMRDRALAVVQWLENEPAVAGLPIGLFASSAETFAAINVAERNSRVVALVSEGGCPNCPEELPSNLRTPTLLLVGEGEKARAAELASAFFARHFVTQ